MSKETDLIPLPIRRLEDSLQNCTLLILPDGHRKTHEALTKEGKDGLYQAEKIFCAVCVGASLKHETARSSPQMDVFSLCYTANTPQTSLPLDHASPPWPQPCKITHCLSSISFTMKSRISSIEDVPCSNTRHPSIAEYCPQDSAQTSRDWNIWKHCHPDIGTAMMLLSHMSNLGHSSLCFLYNFWTWGTRETNKRKNDRRDSLFLNKSLKTAEKCS